MAVKITRIFVAGLLLLLGLALAASGPALAKSIYGKQKVVYHFNDSNPEINLIGLKNIQNHINELGRENLKAVAVVHARAWKLAAKKTVNKDLLARMKKLIAQGVEFRICNNTLKDKKLDAKKDLSIPMTVVPAGVAELVKLQNEGYAYIKP